MTAVITATWVIVALVVVVGLLGVALVIGGCGRRTPTPRPPLRVAVDDTAPSLVPVDVELTAEQMARLGKSFHEVLAERRAAVVEVIEGTPLAQQEFAGRIGLDLGRGERVRAAAADERARLLAELEAEHEILRGRRERDAADLIDRVLPDPSTPKGER